MEQCNGITKRGRGIRCKRRIKITAENTINGKSYCGVHLKLLPKPIPAVPHDKIPDYLKQVIPADILPHVTTFSIEELEFIFLEKSENGQSIVPPDESITLFECMCCINECMEADKIMCSNNHKFCKECLINYVTDRITGGDYKLRCMADSNCNGTFNHKILKNMLDPKLYNSYVEKETQEIMNLAEIKDLYTCPKCLVYSIEIDEAYREKNMKEPKFVCANSTCRFISCLLCKGKFHGKISCDYVKKDENVRKIIEEVLTRHRTRACPKCSKVFMRIDGCNKMTCSCKTVSCYLCKVQIMGYEHFASEGVVVEGKCALFTNEADIEKRSVYLAVKEIYEMFKGDKKKLEMEVYPILCMLEKEHVHVVDCQFKEKVVPVVLEPQKKNRCVIL
ncbi:MAG: putative E3 ubiquitin ligase triad3 [Hyperionvirus sp.]|uniref:Putative E3 ubiquitin ligase triad3 n=1 Tax=Hyperionvirus sp. TaxID=2487770 RepID=A0A3G5AEM1_9VIRU|nr:MAG: putative E3 ubiquitin ligase triad3 [Hyperionvirus sp.]